MGERKRQALTLWSPFCIPGAELWAANPSGHLGDRGCDFHFKMKMLTSEVKSSSKNTKWVVQLWFPATPNYWAASQVCDARLFQKTSEKLCSCQGESAQAPGATCGWHWRQQGQLQRPGHPCAGRQGGEPSSSWGLPQPPTPFWSPHRDGLRAAGSRSHELWWSQAHILSHHMTSLGVSFWEDADEQG